MLFYELKWKLSITSVSCLGATPTVVIADAGFRWLALHSGLSEKENKVLLVKEMTINMLPRLGALCLKNN